MQVAGAEVPRSVRGRRRGPGVCGHCGAGGHDAVNFPYHPKAQARQRKSGCLAPPNTSTTDPEGHPPLGTARMALKGLGRLRCGRLVY